ncbi:MAG TPA: 16S rRNA (cytosine(967)-C(5))-methyltransferase RsmB [Chthoniobacterales bacterium]|nr:16S rRNA (cytosine(967)-C(5))-methyltransferase RsmB [Chthoniobacterales bacterium]
MAERSARSVAFVALKTWRQKKDFADQIISRLLAESNLDSADRAFAVELFYGVLRNLTFLDSAIKTLRPHRVDADVRDLLRLGIYQLLITNTPDHAALNETVGLGSKRLRPIVNAILRSAARQRSELRIELESEPPEIRFSHPGFLIDRWRKQFGDNNAIKLCEWNNQPPPIYARINRLKIDRETFLDRYRNAQPVPKISNFVEGLPPNEPLSRGDCYVQDPSTAVACEMLNPQPGEKILDACAAPGGKTSYLAELMQNKGQIVACDRDPARLRLLEGNLARLDVRIAKVVRHDWIKSEAPDQITSSAPFDRILVDAPCSNTGVMRRRVDVRWRLKPAEFARMQARQLQILDSVLPLLKQDGVLVYSTCSLESEENEDVVQALVRDIPVLIEEDQKKCLPFADNFDGAFAVRFRKTQ